MVEDWEIRLMRRAGERGCCPLCLRSPCVCYEPEEVEVEKEMSRDGLLKKLAEMLEEKLLDDWTLDTLRGIRADLNAGGQPDEETVEKVVAAWGRHGRLLLQRRPE